MNNPDYEAIPEAWEAMIEEANAKNVDIIYVEVVRSNYLRLIKRLDQASKFFKYCWTS